MVNLIKMDMRRLFISKAFIISLIVTAVVNITLQVSTPILMKYLAPGKPYPATQFSDFFANPFNLALLVVMLMLISVTIFSYADISNGYIKNIAGQIPRKSDTIISKFIVICIHNLIFMLVSVLSTMIGTFIPAAMGLVKIENDNLLFAGIMTFFIKWLLTIAICTILLFFTTAVKNKMLATIVGVFLGSGAMGLIYMGLNQDVNSVFKLGNFSVANYAPDQLINSVNVARNVAVANSVIASIVCTAVFLSLTVKVFNSRDVK